MRRATRSWPKSFAPRGRDSRQDNLSEWANFRSSRSTSGWSGRGGQTKNPYALDRILPVSSSGSAVAVARTFARRRLARNDGSIVSPSSFNASWESSPRSAWSARRNHPDAQEPGHRRPHDADGGRRRDSWLSALAGINPRDPSTEQSLGKSQADTRSCFDPRDCRALASGVARKTLRPSRRRRQVRRGRDRDNEKCGAIVVDPAKTFPRTESLRVQNSR